MSLVYTCPIYHLPHDYEPVLTFQTREPTITLSKAEHAELASLDDDFDKPFGRDYYAGTPSSKAQRPIPAMLDR